jgi:lactoylglutathione lyase
MRVHHANLRTVDPVPMVGFYRTLGLALVGCADLGGPCTLYLGDPTGGAQLELTVRVDADADWQGTPGTGHVAFLVDDLEREVRRLSNAGVVSESAPFHPGGRSDVYVAFLRDPDGNHVELVQSPFPHVRDALPVGLTWDD